jgi:hypothetical protein
MDTTMIALVPLLVLGVVMTFAFAGCGHILPTDIPSEEQPAPTPPTTPTPQNPPVTPPPMPAPTPTDAYPKLVLSLGGPTGTLRSYWRLAEPVGALPAADSEPTMPQPGTYKGNIGLNAAGVLRLGSDPNDAAAEFNGTDAFVEAPFSPLLNPPDAFTLEAWVRPSPAGLPATAQAPIITSFQPQGQRGFLLLLIGKSSTVVTVRVHIGVGGANVPLQVDVPLDSPQVMARDGWRHIVVTFGKEAGVNKLRIYVDAGVPTALVATAAQPLNYQAAQELTAGSGIPPFRIGAGANPTPTTFFTGRIDEVALYDSVLDPTVIAGHFLQATTK